MNNEAPDWAGALGIAMVLILIASLGLIAAGGWNWFASFLAGQAAGWAQAIGSIAAIAGAYRMGRAQMRANRVLEESRRAHDFYRRLVAIDAAVAVLELALKMIKETMDRYEPPIFLAVDSHQRRIREAAAIIRGIDLLDCPSAAVIHFLSLVPSFAEDFAETLGVYADLCVSGKPGELKRALPNFGNSFNVVWSVVGSARDCCSKEMQLLQKML